MGVGMEIYDISRTIRKGMPVWPGDQRFHCRWTAQIAAGDLCNVSAVTMSAHTGTHLDAPYHFLASGGSISDVPLSACIGPARVVSLPGTGAIHEADLRHCDWRGVERVLLRTCASELSEDRFDRDFPYLSEAAADFLGSSRIQLLGIDSPSVDAFSSRSMPCHKILQGYSVTILEGIRLASVPPGDYELVCLPLKFAGLEGSPVRAILRK
jgi:arylformamidase